MKFSKLGSSDIEVSRVCLGTMTWGGQNNQQDADAQIEYALSRGVNFFDTAEVYSIPPSKESYGKTETIIGSWLSRNTDKRENIILATKITAKVAYIRNGQPMTRETIIQAVDASLQRLQTDYIDLYQLHWPNRVTAHFGKHWPNHTEPSAIDAQQETESMLDILQGIDQCIKTGKIRYCGLSNESPWGISTYLKLAEKHDLPRMASIQNEFNLLNNKDWPYLVEQCVMDEVAFLPWSPLAGGVLSGKYVDGQRPEGSRWKIPQRLGLFRDTEITNQAIKAYQVVAKKYDVTTAQLSLKWCDSVDGVTSTIIGTTSMQQLEENIDAFDIEYSEEMSNDVEAVLKQFPVTF